MALVHTWPRAAAEWAESVLSEFEGRYRLVDESFSTDTVRIVGPRGQNFEIHEERWSDQSAHAALEFDLKMWAALAFA